jgi:hypothetical protein
MFCIKSSDVNDTDISFISRNNLEMSSTMRGTFSRSSSRLTRHCISDPFDKQASNMSDTSIKLSEILKTRKDNVSRFEEETNAVLAEISNVLSSSMRGTFFRSSSRLTSHCISDPFDKQASNMSLQLSTVPFKLRNIL